MVVEAVIDFTKEPPEITFNDYVMRNHLPLLVPQNDVGEGREGVCTYDYRELQRFCRELMHWSDVPYDPRKGDRSLEDFSEEERRLYYPFAFVLACLDGNAFRTGHLNPILENGANIAPTPETISHYIPDAWAIIRSNGGTLDEVRGLIRNASAPPSLTKETPHAS